MFCCTNLNVENVSSNCLFSFLNIGRFELQLKRSHNVTCGCTDNQWPYYFPTCHNRRYVQCAHNTGLACPDSDHSPANGATYCDGQKSTGCIVDSHHIWCGLQRNSARIVNDLPDAALFYFDERIFIVLCCLPYYCQIQIHLTVHENRQYKLTTSHSRSDFVFIFFFWFMWWRPDEW